MARVTVRLYADLRVAAEKDEVEIEANSVGEILNALVTKFGIPLREALLDQHGTLEAFYRIYVNKRLVEEDELDKKLLADGDIVHMFPPVSGGIEIEPSTRGFFIKNSGTARFSMSELGKRWLH